MVLGAYLLRRFAHTNEGSCAIQVFWPPGEPVTMVRYYPAAPSAVSASGPSAEALAGGRPRARLDVYAGRVVASHPMPPAAGCTTNVEVEITDRDDALSVKATTTSSSAGTSRGASGSSPSSTGCGLRRRGSRARGLRESQAEDASIQGDLRGFFPPKRP